MPGSAFVRAAVRVELERLLDDVCWGDVQIDRIAELSFGGVVAEGVSVRDPSGRTVLRGKRLVLGLAPLALLRLELRFTHGLVEDARIRAIPSTTNAISLFDALSPGPSAEPADGGSSLDVSFEHIHVRRAYLYGGVPGLPELEVVGLEARGEIRVVDGELAVRVTQARGDLTRPYEHALALDHATFALDSSPLRLSAKARVSHRADRVRAALHYRAPEHGDDQLDLFVGLEPVSSELLTDVGIAPAQILLSTLRGHLRLSGPLRDLTLTSTVTSDAGLIVVRGRFPEAKPLTVRIESPALAVERLVAYAPPLQLQVRIEAEAAPQGPVQLRLSAPSLELFGIGFGQTEIAGVYADERLSLISARLRYGGGQFELAGWVDAEADCSLRIRSRVPDVARDDIVRRSGLAGSLRTDVRIDKRGDALNAEGSIGIEAFSFGDFSAKELVVEGRASAVGDLADARVDLRGASWGSAFLGYAIGDVEYTIRGTSPRFAADFGLIDQRARTMDAHLTLDVLRDGYRVRLAPLQVGVAGREPWRAQADITLDDQDITFHKVFLANGQQRLDLHGQYSFSRAYRVDATLQSFDLGGLRELSGQDLADLDGTIDGKLALTGVPGRPRIDAQGSLRQGVFLGMRDLTVLLSLVSVERRFDLDAEVILPDRSRFSVYAGGEPGAGQRWTDQVAAGNYRFGLDFERVRFEVARPWLAWLGLEPPPGSVSATIRGAGTLTAPYLDVQTHVEGLELPGWPALDIYLDAEHDGERAALRELRVDDAYGSIAQLEGFLEAPLSELFDLNALRASAARRPLELALTWRDRRLDQLPRPLRVELAMPATGSLRVAQTDRGPALDLQTQLGWPEGSAGLDACGAARRPRVELTLHAHDLRTTAKLSASLDGQPLAMADVEADTPIVAWLTGEQPLHLPRTSFTLDADTPASEEVPLLCELIAGPLHVNVSALDAFADPPELSVEARSTGLQLVSNEQQRQRLGGLRQVRSAGRPFALRAHGGVEGANLVVRAEIDQGSGAGLRLAGSVPRALLLGAPPSPDWPAAEAELDADRLELASLLVALPANLRGSGLVDGRAHVRYDVAQDQIALGGSLRLSRGRLLLASLGQELSELQASIALSGDTVRIEALEARDFEGRLKLQGGLRFAGARELHSELAIALTDFPIRRESAPVSRLTGELRLRATTTPERTRAELSLDDLRVNLPNDLGQGLQPLDEHPDIVVRGQEPEEPDPDPHLFELRAVAKNPPIRVLRSDLSAEVAADLTVRYRAPELSLEGSAEIKRGSFELYGKRFELGESRLAFDDSAEIDPLVSIDAVHEVGGDEIGVHVSGRLSEPKITFSHSNPAITQPGEIIAQLLGARSTDSSTTATTATSDATGAAAGILAGVTAGLLTQEVRREFGGALPVLSVESSSQKLRSARIRAGVQLDQLIERRLGPLRKVVRGAYVEGFVAPGAGSDPVTSTTTGPQSRGGGLLELRFPKDLVGTIEYRPVQNWRLDLAWEP